MAEGPRWRRELARCRVSRGWVWWAVEVLSQAVTRPVRVLKQTPTPDLGVFRALAASEEIALCAFKEALRLSGFALKRR